MHSTYCYMSALAIVDLVQALGSQQVHQLPLLVCLHACEGHAVQQDSLDQGWIGLLQKVFEGWPCHTARQTALQA